MSITQKIVSIIFLSKHLIIFISEGGVQVAMEINAVITETVT